MASKRNTFYVYIAKTNRNLSCSCIRCKNILLNEDSPVNTGRLDRWTISRLSMKIIVYASLVCTIEVAWVVAPNGVCVLLLFLLQNNNIRVYHVFLLRLNNLAE